MNKAIKAIVIGQPSKEMVKSNNNKYVLVNCEVPGVIDPKTNSNIVVTAQRGTFNAETGEVKAVPAVGSEVMLYMQQLPSTTEPGKVVTFFSMATGVTSADQDSITAAFGNIAQETPASAAQALS